MIFTGEYEHTIDAKQRMAIPSEIRAQLAAAAGDRPLALYLVPGANGHPWLWPEETFERMAGAMEKSLLPAEELMEFEEYVFSQSRRLEIDKAGRVRLPERSISEMGLGQSVVILGVRDHLELRDPARWKRDREDKREKQAEIMLRARRLMEQQRGRDAQ